MITMSAQLFSDRPVGGDPDVTEAIKTLLGASGFDTDNSEAIGLLEFSLRKKIEKIASNCHFHCGSEDPESEKVLTLEKLKMALKDEGFTVDRPEFILEQPQSKMSTRRSKSGK